jgi:hypothetical protein
MDSTYQDQQTGRQRYVGTVDFDRRFRIRDSASKIVWEFPNVPDSTDETFLDSNLLNYISTGEKLISSNGRWFLTITNNGQLISNTGIKFNEPPIIQSGVGYWALVMISALKKVMVIDY